MEQETIPSPPPRPPASTLDQATKKKKRSYASSIWKYVSGSWSSSNNTAIKSGNPSTKPGISLSTSDISFPKSEDIPVVRVMDDEILKCVNQQSVEQQGQSLGQKEIEQIQDNTSNFESEERLFLPSSLEKCNTDQEVLMYLDYLISKLHGNAKEAEKPIEETPRLEVTDQEEKETDQVETETETSYDSMPELEEVPIDNFEQDDNQVMDAIEDQQMVFYPNPAWKPANIPSFIVGPRPGNTVLFTPRSDRAAFQSPLSRRRSRRPPTPYVSRESSQEDDSIDTIEGPLKRVRMEQEDVMSRLEKGEYKPPVTDQEPTSQAGVDQKFTFQTETNQKMTVPEDVRIDIELDNETYVDYSHLLDRIEANDGCATLCDAFAEMWNDVMNFCVCIKEKVQ